jgi:phage antirepressor YoqD-like protein
MNTSIIKFDYNGNQIPFEKGDDVMVNLTAMAKAYPDKNLSTIVNSQEISDYCASLSKLKNFSFADLLIVRKGAPDLGGGTWAHRLVAIRVAQKLNSDLAVWVDMRVDELLKYGMTATQPTLEQMINNPDLVISLATQLKNEREEKQRIETENLYLKEQNEAQRPAVIFTESVKVSSTNILIEDLAKLITQNGYKIGEIRLYNWFVDNGYLVRHKRWSNSRRKYENYYTPTQRAAEMKLFWVSERVISNPGQPQFTRFTCYVTGEGQVYFINKFNKLKVA